jgi:hypothetical protein
MKQQIELLISRYQVWLSLPYIKTSFWKNRDEWEREIFEKINELKNIESKLSV